MAEYYDDPSDPKTPVVDRVRYFSNEFLVDQDFIDDQMFHLAARRRHAAHLHGWGVLEGLALKSVDAEGKATLEEGYAQDAFGREIRVTTQPILVQKLNRSLVQNIYLLFNEGQDSKSQEAGSAGVQGDNRWAQQPLVIALPTTPVDASLRPTAAVSVNLVGIDVQIPGEAFIPIATTKLTAGTIEKDKFTDRRPFAGIRLPTPAQQGPAGLAWNKSVNAIQVQGGLNSSEKRGSDAPQAVWRNAAEQVRGLVDHNGYRADRIDQLYEGWRYPNRQFEVIKPGGSTTFLGPDVWGISTIGNGNLVLAEPEGTDFPSRSIRIQSGDKASQLKPLPLDFSCLFSGALFSASFTALSFVAIWEAKLIGSVNGNPASTLSIGLSGSSKASRPGALDPHNRPVIGWQVVPNGTTFKWNPVVSGVPVDVTPSGSMKLDDVGNWHQFRLEFHGSTSPFGIRPASTDPVAPCARFFFDGVLVKSLPQPAFPPPATDGYSYDNLGWMLFSSIGTVPTGSTQPLGIAVGPLQLYWNRQEAPFSL